MSRRDRVDYACAVEIQLPRWTKRVRRTFRALLAWLASPRF